MVKEWDVSSQKRLGNELFPKGLPAVVQRFADLDGVGNEEAIMPYEEIINQMVCQGQQALEIAHA